MENYSQQPPSKANYKSIDSDKDYFSAYLNMARHNAFITLNDIAEKLQGFSETKEDKLAETSVLNILNEKTQQGALASEPHLEEKIIEQLNKHFPFLMPMLQKQSGRGDPVLPLPADYYRLMCRLLRWLNTFRNYYTHTHHADYEVDNELLELIRATFDAAVRASRDALGVQNNEIEFLRRLSKEKGKAKATEKESFEYKFYDEGKKNISEKGLAYFICLFLEPKYATLFLKKLKGFKRDDEKKYKLTLKAYTHYCIRIPQRRIVSEDTKAGLAMDMLNELKRCPKELYNHLSQANKEKFVYDKTMSEDEIAKVNDLEEGDETQSLIRKKNRFPEFALHYIDEKDLLPGLCFQIDLGNFYFKFYEKTTIDGKQRLRVLSRKMKAFGKIQDFAEPEQPDVWRSFAQYTHLLPENYHQKYISRTKPHYHINNNLIALAMTDHVEKYNKFPKLQDMEPDFFLSTQELLGLLFYDWLTKKEGCAGAVSRLILGHRKKIHDLLDKIITGELVAFNEATLRTEYKIKLKDIPTALQRAAGARRAGKSEAELYNEKLNNMIAETQTLRKRAESDEQRAQQSKPGNRKKEKVIKSGVYASYLAKDMLFMQKNDTNENAKVTSLNFQVLQAALALYGRDKEMLPGIFEKCGFFKAETQHPFLKTVMDKCMNDRKLNTIVKFYQSYLQQREQYLSRCLNGMAECTFRKANKLPPAATGKTHLQQLAEKYKKIPLNLPRGLFKDAIAEYFSSSNADDARKMNAILEKTDRYTTVYLIEKYFLNCLHGDEPLAYYNFERGYPVIDKLEDNRHNFRDPLPKQYYKTNELAVKQKKIKSKVGIGHDENGKPRIRLPSAQGEDTANKPGQKPALFYEPMYAGYKQFCDNEKTLRLYKAQDMMLFLMAKELLFDDVEDKPDLKLKDIVFDNTQNGLSGQGEEHRKDILSTPRRYEIKLWDKTIFQPDLKPKNYGDFRRFVKDRRLPSLFQWMDKENISRKELEVELENYDTVRMEILKQVHAFEKAMFTKYQGALDERKQKSEKSKNRKYYPFGMILAEFIDQHSDYREEKSLIVEIRNKFSHNEYPLPEKFTLTQKQDVKTAATSDKLNTVNAIRDIVVDLFDRAINRLKI